MEALKILVPVFGVFIPALMLPGPDFIGVVRSAMTRGPRSGLQTTVGVSMSLGFYATLSLLGLSAVLVEYQWLTWAIRAFGGVYLTFLGIKLLRAKPSNAVEVTTQDPVRGNAFTFGFLVTLTNPKAIVLFASVFATAINSSTPSWVMVLMISLVVFSALAWYSIVTLLMSSAVPPALAPADPVQMATAWV